MTRKYTDDDLANAIKDSYSMAETCRKIGITPTGGNYRSLYSKIKELRLDISHFTGQGWNIGLKFKPKTPISLDDILVKDSKYTNNRLIKKRLFDKGLKERKCELCQNDTWNGKDIPLELHHINGDNTDHSIENLQILCRNCHGQTDNFTKGNNSLAKRRKIEYLKLKNQDFIITKIPKEKKPKSFCKLCGHPIYNSTRKYCSTECYRLDSKGKRPDVFELLDIFRKYNSFVKVGKHYGVSDTAVKKWCKFYGILDKIKN